MTDKKRKPPWWKFAGRVPGQALTFEQWLAAYSQGKQLTFEQQTIAHQAFLKGASYV